LRQDRQDRSASKRSRAADRQSADRQAVESPLADRQLADHEPLGRQRANRRPADRQRSDRRARHRETDERTLLTAAEHVFAQRGHGQASMREIAAAAGFSVGGLYQFFASKDELFLAVLDALRHDFEEATADAGTRGTFDDRLLELTQVALTFFADRRAFLITLMTERGSFSGAFKDRVAKAVGQLKRARREQVLDVLRLGVKEGRLRFEDLDFLASAYLGVLSQCNLDAQAGVTSGVPSADTLLSLFCYGAARSRA
jgi:TetR/AcrR family transcriptional regulator, cholesterol catabolism regulator